MVVMREWLDLNGCAPTRFDCRRRGAEVVLFVDFSTGAAAEGFARRFNGQSGASTSAQKRFALTAKQTTKATSP
jgi:hypothetical protein